jgi:hypothetical protein
MDSPAKPSSVTGHSASAASIADLSASDHTSKPGYGQWKLVRIKKAMPCDARCGTFEQVTVDGTPEVFQCDVTMPTGELPL